jgi:hypothetical protein
MCFFVDTLTVVGDRRLVVGRRRPKNTHLRNVRLRPVGQQTHSSNFIYPYFSYVILFIHSPKHRYKSTKIFNVK